VNKVTWLLERTAFDDKNPDKIASIAQSMGHEVIWCNYVPFEAGLVVWGKPHQKIDLPGDKPVVWYGSINGGRWLQRNSRATPGLWADFEGARSYYSHWGHHLLSPNGYVMLPLAEIKRRRQWVYEQFGKDGSVFIRPDDNAKSFAGEVVAEEHFDRWYSQTGCYDEDITRLCIVARPKRITAEWRLVIADRKVIAGSLYRRNGLVEQEGVYSSKVREKAEEIASGEFSPAPVYVMDIAEVDPPTRMLPSYHLVEIGAINTAGLYEMDMQPVVEQCSEVAVREYEEINSV
jgi:hypothetical protein